MLGVWFVHCLYMQFHRFRRLYRNRIVLFSLVLCISLSSRALLLGMRLCMLFCIFKLMCAFIIVFTCIYICTFMFILHCISACSSICMFIYIFILMCSIICISSYHRFQLLWLRLHQPEYLESVIRPITSLTCFGSWEFTAMPYPVHSKCKCVCATCSRTYPHIVVQKCDLKNDVVALAWGVIAVCDRMMMASM